LIVKVGFELDGRFEMYVPLHRLWLGYISELLGLGPQPEGTVTEQNAAMPNVATVHAKMVKADFHGSIMTGDRRRRRRRRRLVHSLTTIVRRSKNPCLVGLSGIVIYESENGFRVITRSNKVKREFVSLSSPSPFTQRSDSAP
jgi:ribonuclease P protein subunit POP4